MSNPISLWTSPLDINTIFEQAAAPNYPTWHDGQLLWLEVLPKDKARIALVRQTDAGDTEVITPPQMSIRSGVHEYGGRCHCIGDGTIFFNNYFDGQVYAQSIDPNSSATAIAPSVDLVQHADLNIDVTHQRMVAVREIAGQAIENRNQIVLFDLSADKRAAAVLCDTADFYAAPSLSADGNAIAWIEWSHPWMPWDESRVMAGRLIQNKAGQFSVSDIHQIAGGKHCAVSQLQFLQDGSLVFAMDASGGDAILAFWNLYRWRPEAEQLIQLTRDQAEYGAAHWVFGQDRWGQNDESHLLAIRSGANGDDLVNVALDGSGVNVLQQGLVGCANFNAGQASSSALLLAAQLDRDPEIVSLDPKSNELTVLRPSSPLLESADLSKPEAIEFPNPRWRNRTRLFLSRTQSAIPRI